MSRYIPPVGEGQEGLIEMIREKFKRKGVIIDEN